MTSWRKEYVNILLSHQLIKKDKIISLKNTGNDVETVQSILKFIIPENNEHIESIGMVVERLADVEKARKPRPIRVNVKQTKFRNDMLRLKF